jgi:hypothetical protein
VRSPIGRRHAALAALSVGVLITAGCGWGGAGDGEASAAGAKDLHFQPVAAQGPDPFTESTAVPPSAADLSTTSSTTSSRDERGGEDSRGPQGGEHGAVRTPRALPGSTPGLYGGSPAASCDVERQVRLLTEDRAKVRAFARGTNIDRASVPAFLRGLTPVVLRVDIRVTAHGYRAGAPTSFQSVLQTGTAVMVDEYGLPRVRCAGGNPLGGPFAATGSVSYRGTPWRGYLADRVVVINRAPRPLDSLVIVGLADHAWTERRTGTDGGEDRPPGTLPPYSPDADITDPGVVGPPDATTPDTSSAGREEAPGAAPDPVPPSAPNQETDAPSDQSFPGDDAPLPQDAAPDPDADAGLGADPDAEPGDDPGGNLGADLGADLGGDGFAPSEEEFLPPVADGEQLADDPAGFDTFDG